MNVEIAPKQKIGRWLIIEKNENSPRKAWLCECECGTQKIVLDQSLKSNKSTQCRNCSNRQIANNYFKNITNKIFGEWKVLKYSHSKNRKTFWLCECSCGTVKTISSDTLTSGKSKKCKNHNCYKEIKNGNWSTIIYGAKSRGINFEVSIKYAYEIYEKQNKKCSLSGLKIFFGKGSKRTASLDRIDSSKGYIEGNIQWVHKDINIMKMALSNKDFINYCYNVSNFHSRNLCKFNNDSVFIPDKKINTNWVDEC